MQDHDESSSRVSVPQGESGEPVLTPGSQAPAGNAQPKTFEVIRHLTAWVMICSAVLFALVGILATWQIFGQNAGDVVWRAFSSLAIIAFASLIVNVASRSVAGNS